MQQAYRLLVHATSFPGSVIDLAPLFDERHGSEPAPATAMLLARTLLDAEVTFSCSTSFDELSPLELAQVTYARPATAESARFLIVCHRDADEQDGGLCEAIDRANAGTLSDPHLGATVIGLLPSIANDAREVPADDRVALTLSGPGIDGSRELFTTAPTEWIERRAERNREFPLGIDLLLFSRTGQLISLPRTTQVVITQETEARWAT
jgi:alpha-D-ribose 1-methylphosphonate 5-triphosphate synthase subunit PhnH